jgi:hypothetical protein
MGEGSESTAKRMAMIEEASDARRTRTGDARSPEAAIPSGAAAPQRGGAANGMTQGELERLQEKVSKTYGAFGVRAAESETEDWHAVVSNNDWKSTALLVAGVTAASMFLTFASAPTWANPGEWANSFRLDTAFALVWVPLLYWAMARQKISQSLRVYLVLALFIEAFSETMFIAKGEGGYWDSILWPAAVAYFGTLKEFAGVPGGSLPVFFVVTVGLLYRAIHGRRASGRPAPPRFARNAMLVFLGAVVALSAYGIARGGQIEWTFRQVVFMLELPVVGLLFLYALRVPEDLPAIGAAYIVTALARSLLVIYVYFGVCMPAGITELPGKPEWCTTHSDTVLFVSAIAILFARAVEPRTGDATKRQRRKLILRSLAIGAVIFFAIVLNNRRLAFVSLALAPLVAYLALPASKRKRRVTTALIVAVPLIAAYVLIGSESTSTSPLLKPAKSIVSVLDAHDTSAVSRDIENENLIYTLRQSPFVTKGFGHEYEYSPENPPVDLTETFTNFRLIAHNGVLWLWSIAGVLGFAFLWFIYPMAGTLAVRGYRAAETPVERTAALASFAGVAICVVQIWGDQGLSSTMTLVTFGVCFAVASRLALRASWGSVP